MAKSDELIQSAEAIAEWLREADHSLRAAITAIQSANRALPELSLHPKAIETSATPTIDKDAKLDGLMSLNDTASFLGLSRQTIWKLRRQGRFPPIVEISKRKRAFRTSDISDWLKTQSRAG